MKQRMDRFDEAVEVIVSLLTEPTTDFAGVHYTLKGAYCEPKPVQQPHPPIVIGGSGEKRTLRTVARFAQHWNYVGGPVAEYTRLKSVLAQHCAAIGRDPQDIMTSAHLRFDGSNVGGLTEEAAAFADAGLDLGIIYLPPPHTPSVLEPVADAVRSLC
jgi:alkanesulfonate monooxygenase SsuD/methylene tetrahydromethanopterin reductase-like flavin-dependent oxidoreductase (luciferase family)